MNLIKTCLLCLSVAFTAAVTAEPWYQVEVIVFDRLYPELDGEQWQAETYIPPNNTVELQTGAAGISAAPGRVPYQVLNDGRNRLGGIYRLFKVANEYRPLIHRSWQQPATGRERARHVRLQRLAGGSALAIENRPAEEPEFVEDIVIPDRLIDGSIRIRSGFQLHADVDLAYFKRLPAENKIIRSGEESFADTDKKSVIRLKATRKMKLNELHYFDHPLFGVILQVSRLQGSAD